MARLRHAPIQNAPTRQSGTRSLYPARAPQFSVRNAWRVCSTPHQSRTDQSGLRQTDRTIDPTDEEHCKATQLNVEVT